MGRTFSILLVDDERLARSWLRELLQDVDEIGEIFEASCVAQAIQMLSIQSIDLIFLDVQMPGGDGFQLFERFNVQIPVIFVTAYDQHALRAFEVSAVDYLVKPVDKRRLLSAFQRICQSSSREEKDEGYAFQDNRIYLSDQKTILYPYINEILFFEACGDYSEVYLKDGRRLLTNIRMKEWEKRLIHMHFFRIHRKYLLNSIHISSIQKQEGNSWTVQVGVDHSLPIGRRRLDELKTKLSELGSSYQRRSE